MSLFYQKFGDSFRKEWMKEIKIVEDPIDVSLSDHEKEVIAKKNAEKIERQIGKVSKGVDDFFKVIKYAMFLLLPVYALVFKILYRRTRAFYVDHLVYAMHLQSFAYVLMAAVLVIPFFAPVSLTVLKNIIIIFLLVYIGISLHFLYKQVWWKTGLKAILATFSIVFITTATVLIYAVLDGIFFQ
jgi:hypothetical protein